jgi:hypothetical protein
MRRILYIIVFQILVLASFAQSNPKWQGYFSYNSITDLSETPDAIYASSENALFSQNPSTQALKTINSIDGLKAETITAIYRSQTSNMIFVGNSNGLLLIVNSDGTILQRRGIIDVLPIPPTIKGINHFLEFNGKVYLSCDYGISVFDLSTMEFGDTYYIGSNGNTEKIYQTTIFNNEIYAVTQNYGIKKALLSNPDLVDFSQWSQFNSSNWNGITTYNNQLVAANTDQHVYKFVNTTPQLILSLSMPCIDIRSYGDKLIVCAANEMYVTDTSFSQLAHIQTYQVPNISPTFTCATVINNIIYIGSTANGVISCPISSPGSFEFIMPNGPIQNYIFRLRKTSSTLWALYGSYSRYYNPYNPGLGQYPISKYTTQNGWDMIPYSQLLGAKSLSNIAVNPNNENIMYVSSYFSGLLKVENGVATQLYTNTNTGANGNGLETLVDPSNPSYGPDIRVNGPVFDRNGNLWMTNNMVNKGLKELKSNGTWQSYDLSTIIGGATAESYAIPTVDKNGTKWLSTEHNGLIAYNESVNKHMTFVTGTSGNLPDTSVRCTAIDNKNQLWIGTARGLRIIQSVDQFLSETDIQTKAIIILENDLAQELFYEQFILDIAVDGANRKWVSISDSGVYLVSSNGQETIYHFTKDNSPLPSNNILDIEIDGVTGDVYFATDKGLVAYKGTATKASDNLSEVYVYPNPVRPEYSGTVKISGLTNKANVKITDIEGNLVYETTSEGGTIEWDTTAFGKYRVASGVYMIFVAASDASDTIVKKVMIIR